MIREHFQFRQTIATIIADEARHIAAAKEGMLSARQDVERQIARDPFFAATLEPYRTHSESLAIRRMIAAGTDAGVGPMAAVAGTIAWAGVEAMVEAGATFGLVDNGGDIAVISDRDVRVGIFAGEAPLSGRIAFVLPPQEEILGVCTSSATVGPSISFGTADAVTVISRDVAGADAWATAIGNRISTEDRSVLSALTGTDVQGVLCILGDVIVRWGALPPILRAEVDEALITAGKPLI